MTGQMKDRWSLTLFGALGGFLFWAAIKAHDEGYIGDRPALMLAALVGVFFAAALAMAGPIGLVRASLRAAGLSVITAALVGLASLRYAEAFEFLYAPMPFLAALTVASLPIPFLVTAARPGWRDYPALFLESWSILVRYAAAGAFTALVWLVIFLSSEVLMIVGVDAIRVLLEHEAVPVVVTGAMVGLGMAVVYELADMLSPSLILRLFRLFLPVVLVVMVVFLIALPFRGIDGLVQGLSPGVLLLVMVAAGISLVSVTIDRNDGAAAESPILRRAAQGMALILPVLAGLAGWAVWLRVGQHGWTPDRVFLAVVALIGLAYGLVYALSVLRGAGWMERIRRGNLIMALVVIGVAALWLTPLLNAERIAASDQLARILDGTTPLDRLDPYVFRRWGKPGADALAALEARAKEPGQEALAKVLAGETEPELPDRATLVAEVSAVMPVQPGSATGTRDSLLTLAPEYLLQDWKLVCESRIETGAPGCLMVVADLLPLRPGEEALLLLERGQDYAEIQGLYVDDSGSVSIRSVGHPDGRFVPNAEASALLRSLQDAPPPLTGAELNQLGTGADGIFLLP